MRILVAAIAIAALVAAGSAPALADMGGMVKQNGQCWKPAKTMDGGTFGHWDACAGATPAPATAAHHSQPTPKHEHAH
jgi:hypothetical protein